MERVNNRHEQDRHHNLENKDIYGEGDQSQEFHKTRLRRPSGHYVPDKSSSSPHTRFTSKAQPSQKVSNTANKALINVRPVSNGSLSSRTPRSQLNTPREVPPSPKFLGRNEVDIESYEEERLPHYPKNKETNFFIESEIHWIDSQSICSSLKALKSSVGSELKKSVSSCTVDGLGFDLETIDLTNYTDRRVKACQKSTPQSNFMRSRLSSKFGDDDQDAYEKPEQVESGSGSSDNERLHSARRYISVESLVLEDNFNAIHIPKKTSSRSSEDSDLVGATTETEDEIPQVKVVWTTPPPTRSKKIKEVPAAIPQDTGRENILNFFTRTEDGVEKEGRFDDVQPIINKFFSVTEDNGVSIRCINLKQVLDNMDEFVLQPAAIGYDVQCRVTRDRKGVDRGLYPTYYMHLERPDGRKILLLTGRKRKKSTTSNYLISTDAADLSRDSTHFVGKVRSNLLGTQFKIYDNGQSHKRFGLFQAYGTNTPVREELAAVIYEPNVLGFKGPRKMKVLIPEMKNEARRREHRPDTEKDSILDLLLKQGATQDFFELKNKAPIWNDDNQSFVLNFHGRVTQASVKNFQIIHEKMDDYVVLQFGRVASDLFTMDYRYPLCALQAFAIVLTSFDNKLACE